VTTCVISQPRLFPPLHYLHRMLTADIFIILDSVQFNPRHEENRFKVKGVKAGEWITIPTQRGPREQLIRDTHLDNSQPWAAKAIKTLQHLYGKTPHYATYAPAIHKVLEQPYDSLTPLDRASWQPALELLNVQCRFLLASELPVTEKGSRLLLELCKQVGADTYVSGMFGRDYLDVDGFAQEGVGVLFHDYVYQPYPQRHGDFVPFLSYLDTLFNAGLERDLILACGKSLPPAALPPKESKES
jgi:hypothetical protein